MDHGKKKLFLLLLILSGVLFTGTSLVTAEELGTDEISSSSSRSVYDENDAAKEKQILIETENPDVESGNPVQNSDSEFGDSNEATLEAISGDSFQNDVSGDTAVKDLQPEDETAYQESKTESPDLSLEKQFFISNAPEDSDTIMQGSSITEERSDMAEQESDAAEQESDAAEEGSDMAEQESDVAEQESDVTDEGSDKAEQESDAADEGSDMTEQESDAAEEGSDKAEQKSDATEEGSDMVEQNSDKVEQETGIKELKNNIRKAAADDYMELLKAKAEKMPVFPTRKKPDEKPDKKANVSAPSPKMAGSSSAMKKYPQIVPNGVYTFLSLLNPFKALDIAGGSTRNRANAQLYDLNNSGAQHYRITFHPQDGTYSIMNVKSGKYLDAVGGRNVNGTNIQQYAGNNTAAQRWIIEKAANGSYTIRSAMKGRSMVLDVSGARSANGTNVQLYSSNGTKAQQFRLQPFDPAKKVNLSAGAVTISSALKADGSAVLDIRGASLNDGANLQLYRPNGSAAQQFILTPMGGGQYRLMSAASGHVLSVENGRMRNRTNVRQEQENGSSSQRWKIMDAGDGTVYVKAVNADQYLDISGGRSANGTNAQIYQGNGTNAQKFRLTRVNRGPIADGVYNISSASDRNWRVDITGGSKKVDANVQMYKKNNSNAQKFRFMRGSDGFYTIVNVGSGHALDVADGYVNLRQAWVNGSLGQKWLPRVMSDGSIMMINARSGKMLDMRDGRPESSEYVREQQYNSHTNAQRFRLEKTNGTVTAKRDKSVDRNNLASRNPDAYRKLKEVGTNLRAAQDWCASLPWVDCGMSINVGTRTLADVAFTRDNGDCYVKSAALYEMGKILGYDIHQVHGYVPTGGGNRAVHAWVEVEHDGDLLVCDPSYQHNTGIDSFMFHYGDPGMYHYLDYGRVS